VASTNRLVLLACGATFVAVALWTGLFASRGHFSGDHGVKFAQSVALWESGFSSRALDGLHDPRIDPGKKYFPFGDLVRIHEGERQGIYSILFTAVGSLGIGALGIDGILLLPLAGLALALAGVMVLGRRLEMSPWLTVAAVVSVGLLTPLFFYAGQYQEHSLATGLVTLGAALLVPDADGRRQPAIAGALMAAAACIRPECYCALSAAGLIVIVQPSLEPRRIVLDGLWFVGAALALLGAYWIVNHVLSGTWDPLVTQNEKKVTPPRNDRKMLFGTFKGTPLVAPMLALHISVYFALLPIHRLGAVARASLRVAAGLAMLTISVWALGASDDRTAVGLLSCTPLVAYGLLSGPWQPRAGALWLFALTFIVEVIFFDRSGTGGGLQYGTRFLLPAVPILFALAMRSLDEDLRAPSWLPRLLASIALASFTVYGAKAMRVANTKAKTIVDGGTEITANTLAFGGDVIVTRRWWESQVLSYALLDGKTLLNVPGDPRHAYSLLRDAGVRRFTLVTRGLQKVRLDDGSVVRTVNRRLGWLEAQAIEIVPPPPR
jgi:hypothetical protein